MTTLAHDVRYAIRMLRRSPGFAVVAIVTLGLGIGATTAIFTIVNGVLLRPLPYREPGRVVSLWVDFGVGAQSLPAMSAGDFRDYQQRSRSFEQLAAGSGANLVGATGALTAAGETERVEISPVTANFFPMLGIDPVHGRHFTAEDERLEGPPVVLLSYGLWARRFGRDPDIVGKRIQLDGFDQTVVGVMPESFQLLLPSEAFLFTDSQIWKPLRFNYERNPQPRNLTNFTVMGRLKPGVSVDQAQAEMTSLAAQLRKDHSELESGDMRVRVVPLQHDVVKHARAPLWALFGAVSLLLLIACANVAHLLLARATSREREVALRGALGASRRRVIRQLVTESVVLALAGGALGLLLAYIGIGVLVRVNPSNLPRLATLHIDATALAFAMAASVLTATLFGLVPAVRAASVDLNRTLRGAGSATAAHVGLRSALMIAEMALALVLLVGAGLMIRTFEALSDVKPGFDPTRVLTFRLALPFARYNPEARAALLRKLSEQLRALPGVSAVALTSQLPLTGSGPLSPYAYNEATARNWESETSDGRGVSPAYFDVMGTHLVAGRPFEMNEAGRQDVVIVDTTLAARAWPGENPIGKRLQTQPNGSEQPFVTVVGVVEHQRTHDLSRAVRPQIYLPIGPNPRLYVVLRTSVDPASLSPRVRQLVAAIDPYLPIDRLRPMTDYIGDSLAQARMNLVVMSMFGAAALLLASIGVYGVFSYSVGQRTKEIGIRIALGQEPARVRNLVLLQGLRLIAISTAIGLGAAYLLSRTLSTLLYEVHPADAWTFGTMSAVLMLVALVGCYIPARRATAVNPLLALKTE